DRHFTEVVLPLAEVRREEVGGEGRHVAGIFEEQQRIHLRALPGDNEHRQQNGPAYEREPAALWRREGDGLHVLLRGSLCAGWRYAYPAYDLFPLSLWERAGVRASACSFPPHPNPLPLPQGRGDVSYCTALFTLVMAPSAAVRRSRSSSCA